MSMKSRNVVELKEGTAGNHRNFRYVRRIRTAAVDSMMRLTSLTLIYILYILLVLRTTYVRIYKFSLASIFFNTSVGAEVAAMYHTM